MSQPSASYGQSSHPFVDPEFEIPGTLETDRFRLRMLTVNDVVKDFEAVTTSKEHLQDIWGPGWPEDLTLEQNLIDLGWHQKEFQRRRSFAYTVVALDESRVLGCVYIYPTRKTGYDAEVYLWARQSELASGMETELTKAVKTWLKAKWPFKNPALPGTDISIEEWHADRDRKLPLRPTMTQMKNLLKNIPDHLPEEHCETLVETDAIHIERIISKGHSAPQEGWYDQDQNEWVLVLKGAARLAFEDGSEMSMGPGDSLEILAHVKHKVVWTDPEEETVWVAAHYQ